ncbi:hypothetical protein RyT2_11460 [Pseudolactococcus yaeyamensis]
MKKLLKALPILILSLFFFAACGNSKSAETKADFTEAQFEKKLNDGEDLEGKTVKIKVLELVPDSAAGYNIQAGEHLNFVSKDNPKIKKGDTLVVKADKITSTLGSYLITYTKK